jgi:hypothetical protein
MNGAGAACESYHQFKVEIAGLVSMRMIMYAKEEARNEVRGKPSTSDNQDNFRILNLYSRSVQAHLTVTEYHVTLYIYNLSTDNKIMLKPNASWKIPLKKLPNSCVQCHP